MARMTAAGRRLFELLDDYAPRTPDEVGDVARIRQLASESADPWTRASLLHATGSAIIVHPESRRVLLRWHERQQAWLQVGGHADPGEIEPSAIAAREAREETGLTDLRTWPDAERARLVHVAIVPVPAARGEPRHEHADFRYLLATSAPDEAMPESASAQLRWLTIDEALAEVAEHNLRESLARVADLLDQQASV
jgi:8-oxo-dGTP pyrophosphatase MutT (NUDIX family)